jgi:hypothetical protein
MRPGQIQQQQQQQQQQQSRQATQDRIDQLQRQRRGGRLGAAERRELQQLQGERRRTQQSERNRRSLEQLQQKSESGRLTRNERQRMQRLQREQRREQQRRQAGEQQQQQQQQTLGVARDSGAERTGRRDRRQLRTQRVSAEQAVEGRFATQARRHFGDRTERRANRANRLAARAAWRLGLLATYVPWHGPIYWPYAYTDVFYYTFWPDAYEPAYWAFVYDDFFDGIFFPYGAPYVEEVFAGPYGPAYTGTTGSAPSRAVPGRITQQARQICTEPTRGVTAWPFEQIEKAVQPNDRQRRLLENLKKAAAQAAADFRDACPDTVPMTPPGRLQAMTRRLTATLDAVTAVRPAMEAFYNALDDEQKARFNEIGPEVARRQTAAADRPQDPDAACGGEKAGLSGLAVERIEEAVEPTDAQYPALDRLSGALGNAVDILGKACPTVIPLTPVGRLEVMQARLEAMIAAGNAVRPALEDFYAALDSEQKAKFNRLGRETVQAER